MPTKKADEVKKPATLGSKEVAAMFNLDPKYLRQILRGSGRLGHDKHTRYEWEKDDPFLKKTLPEIIAKYKDEHERGREKAKLPPKKAKKAKGAPPSTENPKPAKEKKAKAKKTPKPQPDTTAPDVPDAVEEIPVI